MPVGCCILETAHYPQDIDSTYISNHHLTPWIQTASISLAFPPFIPLSTPALNLCHSPVISFSFYLCWMGFLGFLRDPLLPCLLFQVFHLSAPSLFLVFTLLPAFLRLAPPAPRPLVSLVCFRVQSLVNSLSSPCVSCVPACFSSVVLVSILFFVFVFLCWLCLHRRCILCFEPPMTNVTGLNQ